jgi:hypothetical protein
LSIHYSYPFIKCFGTGGKEFYKLDDLEKLATFFDLINVKYQRTTIDIDNLKKNFCQKIKEDLETKCYNLITFPNIRILHNFIIEQKIYYK